MVYNKHNIQYKTFIAYKTLLQKKAFFRIIISFFINVSIVETTLQMNKKFLKKLWKH